LRWSKAQERGRLNLAVAPQSSGSRPSSSPPGDWGTCAAAVHGFGGGAYAVGFSLVVFSHRRRRCLWCLERPGGKRLKRHKPRRLTSAAERSFGDGLIDEPPRPLSRDGRPPVRDRLGRCRWLAASPLVFIQPPTSASSRVLSPSGSHLAGWSAQQPFMALGIQTSSGGPTLAAKGSLEQVSSDRRYRLSRSGVCSLFQPCGCQWRLGGGQRPQALWTRNGSARREQN